MTNACLYCRSELIANKLGKFCSQRCFYKHRMLKKSLNRNTNYQRVKLIVKKRDVCYLKNIGGCSDKRIEIHHIDGDISNNDLSNLVVLCTTHHRLIHSGAIDLKNPVMPKYRIDKNGKRRYLK